MDGHSEQHELTSSSEMSGDEFQMNPDEPSSESSSQMHSSGSDAALDENRSKRKKRVGTCFRRHGKEPIQSEQIKRTDGSVSTFKYDPIVAREFLVRLIAAEGLPLNIGESPHFVEYIQKALCPEFRSISRKTIIKDTIKYFNKVQVDLKREIKNLNFPVSLTSEIWSSATEENYLSVAAHYIDLEWNFQKRIIGFRVLDEDHSAESISRNILSVIEDWGLQKRIISMTLDNAVASSGTISIFDPILNGYNDGLFIHDRCACHIINLIVKSCMKSVSLPVDNIRSVILWLRSSDTLITEFKEYCKTEGLKPRQFGPDMPTWWDSTLFMLKNIIPYKNVLTTFYNAKCGDHILREEVWIMVEKLVSFLEIFHESSVLVSGVYYPTSNLVLLQIAQICEMFYEYRSDPMFTQTVEAMEAKFQKYWRNLPMLYCFGFILDPRIKYHGLNVVLTNIGHFINVDYSTQIASTLDRFYELYRQYENRFGYLRVQQLRQTSTTPKTKSWRLITKYVMSCTTSPSPSSSSSAVSGLAPPRPSLQELKMYLDTDFLVPDPTLSDAEFDVLLWWKSYSLAFPVLSRLARDVLTVPVSTVSSEFVFNTTAKILEERRSLLYPDMVERLQCLKDWEHAKRRTQHSAHDRHLEEDFELSDIEDDDDE